MPNNTLEKRQNVKENENKTNRKSYGKKRRIHDFSSNLLFQESVFKRSPQSQLMRFSRIKIMLPKIQFPFIYLHFMHPHMSKVQSKHSTLYITTIDAYLLSYNVYVYDLLLIYFQKLYDPNVISVVLTFTF